MERRLYPRHDLDREKMSARVVLNGKSLVHDNWDQSVEIDAKAINISRQGMCIKLSPRTTWGTLTPTHELEIHLEQGTKKETVKGKVVHVIERGKVFGLFFDEPLHTFCQA